MKAFPISLTLKRVLLLTLAPLAVALVAPLAANPSGGPYGPVQKKYELPKAKHLFYVAPDGRAEASGESLNAPTTLAKAMAAAVTGDAVILRGGTYRTGGITFNQGIIVQPYSDERPVLKGTEVATQWTAAGKGVWSTSWERLFPAQPADWWNREQNEKATPLYLFNNDMVFLDGELLAAVGDLRDVEEKTYFIDYPAGRVYLGSDPEGHTVEITTQDSALIRTIRSVHGRPNDPVGPVIRGLSFIGYAYRALEVEGTEPKAHLNPSQFGKEVVGTVLEDLAICYCSRVAGYFRGDKLVMRNCLVSDCGTEGIYVIDSADVLLEKNIVRRTNSAEKFTGYYASAVKIFNQSYRVVVRDNLIIDNPYASGVWYDVGNVDGLIVDNWMENTNDGFFFEISKGAVCIGNTFVNCNRGVHILNSCNVQVYQNTFFNSDLRVERNDRGAAPDDVFGWHVTSGPEVSQRKGHVIVNNLFAGDETYDKPSVRFYQAPPLKGKMTGPQVDRMDGNVYARKAGGRAVSLIEWSPAETETTVIGYTTLEAFQKANPTFETHASAYADYWGPLFVSPDLKRFELVAGFPGANKGVPLPEEIAGRWKPKHASPVFPGAYEPR